MPPTIKAAETGPGVYRFLVGDALLECRRNLHNDERFAASVEWALALCEDVIQKYDTWWRKAMVKVLLDENGKPLVDDKGRWLKPGEDIPKTSQYKRLAALVLLLRKAGILAKQPEVYEDATGLFRHVLEERGQAEPKATGEEEEEEEDDD